MPESMNYVTEIFKKLIIFPIRNFFILLNSFNNNGNAVIWLLSEGRSGSTWVSSLLSNNGKALQVFEPFHPEVTSQNSNFTPYAYNSNLTSDSEVIKFYKQVFTGRLLHRRVNYDNRRVMYSGIVVKDIFASLTSKAVYAHHKDVKVIILIRNPLDVVLSKRLTAKQGWFWPNNLDIFLNNEALLANLTAAQKNLIYSISQSGSESEKQMVHWIMSYFVSFLEFDTEDYYLLFYESIKATPDIELVKIRRFLGSHSKFYSNDCNLALITSMSRTLQTSNSHTNWKEKIYKSFAKKELNTMSKLLQTFNLTSLYGNDGLKFKQ
ncbi:sulfotransferase domain-containing protein [Glaciecola sp. MF2-115]|uniref:sulfotransferase domain-containing protein n=1 Tax=Glaciecola sp. MF2-115 TaxID=3384827 RepID=UPI0039A23332